MNEMKYTAEYRVNVLQKGSYAGFDFFILSLGHHPTAYVRIPKGHKYYDKDYDLINEEGLDCNFGLTYSNDDFGFNPIVVKEAWWIGWDYSHCSDYSGIYFIKDKDHNIPSAKKWTTAEIFEEVKEVIKQLQEDKDE